MIALIFLGLCSAGMTSPWQYRVEHLAGPGAVLVASLPASAGNLGDAVGALIGGRAIDVGGVPAAILAAAVLATVAMIVAITTRFLRPPPVSRFAIDQSRTLDPRTPESART